MHARSTTTRRPRRGFSLIELLIIVVIIGVLIGISGGAIGRQIARDRVIRSANVVQGLLTEASQQAVRRNVPVRVVLNGTAVQIIDRDANVVIKQRYFGPEYDLRAAVAFSPANGITIFPNGRADAGLRIALSGVGYETTVSRTATGIVRRQ